MKNNECECASIRFIDYNGGSIISLKENISHMRLTLSFMNSNAKFHPL